MDDLPLSEHALITAPPARGCWCVSVFGATRPLAHYADPILENQSHYARETGTQFSALPVLSAFTKAICVLAGWLETMQHLGGFLA